MSRDHKVCAVAFCRPCGALEFHGSSAPTLKRWAIIGRPCGTKLSANFRKALDLTAPSRLCRILCRNLCRTNESVCWPFDKDFDKVSKIPGPGTGSDLTGFPASLQECAT